MKRKQPTFRMKFEDLIEAISERAAILKAQGKTSKPQTTTTTAKVASAKTTAGPQQYNSVLKNSPPKVQQELPTKPKCEMCRMQHKTEECGRLITLSVEKRQEELRKRAMCFKCLTQGHIGRYCPNEQPVCKHCGKNHQSILHVEFEKPKEGETASSSKTVRQTTETPVQSNEESGNKKA